MALSEVKKPRVLALVSDGNDDLSDAVSSSSSPDGSAAAPFATLPLNGNFSQVQVDRLQYQYRPRR